MSCQLLTKLTKWINVGMENCSLFVRTRDQKKQPKSSIYYALFMFLIVRTKPNQTGRQSSSRSSWTVSSVDSHSTCRPEWLIFRCRRRVVDWSAHWIWHSQYIIDIPNSGLAHSTKNDLSPNSLFFANRILVVLLVCSSPNEVTLPFFFKNCDHK